MQKSIEIPKKIYKLNRNKNTAADAVEGNVQDTETNGKYSISEKALSHIENYQKRVESWDGKTMGFSFVMGESPSYLSNIEVRGKKIGKKQVRIDATKVKDIMKNHPEMKMEVIKNLPFLLNDPILVLDSKTVPGRLVLLGEIYAKGKPVMMALEINPTLKSGNSTYVDVIKIASAYTRRNTQNMINTSNVRYVNNNKSRVDDWLKVNRLQLPLPNSQSNSATNSIIENKSNVNRKSEKNSENSKKSSSEDLESIRFSIKDNKIIVDTDRDIFDGVERSDYGRVARDYMREHFRYKSVDNIAFKKHSEQEYIHSAYTAHVYAKQNGVYDAKMKPVTELDNLLSVASFVKHEDTLHPKSYNRNGYDRYEFPFVLDGEEFHGELLIAIDEKGERNFYDVVNVKRKVTEFKTQQIEPVLDKRFSLHTDNDFSIDKSNPKQYNKENTKNGGSIRNEENRDTELLAKQGSVRGVDRSRNRVWKQSQNPEDVYQRLANCQNGKGRIGETRAGHSGWIRDTQGDQSFILRFGEDVLRDLRGRKLSEKDTEVQKKEVSCLVCTER